MTDIELDERLASIEKSLADAAKIRAETEILFQKSRLEMDRLITESTKARAETSLIDKKVKWYEIVILGIGFITAGAGWAKLFS